MISAVEVKKRLVGEVQRAGLSNDQERVYVSVVNLLVPAVVRIVLEELREERSKQKAK